MYTNPQCRWNSQATMFSGNQRYTCTHTKTMYDVCAHSSLPTSAILVLGLLEKKKMMNNFTWAAIMHFRISGASQAYFDSFKDCYQCAYYCRECLYSQISLKVCDSEEKLHCVSGVFIETASETSFSQISLKVCDSEEKLHCVSGVFVETASEMSYCTMGHVFSRSWHSCKLICKRSSSIHNSSYWWVNDILTQRR